MRDPNIFKHFYMFVSINCVYLCSFVTFISDKCMKNKRLLTFSLTEQYK